LDLNKDGVITFEEVLEFNKMKFGDKFGAKYDKIRQHNEALFTQMDANGDKQLERKELLDFFQAMYNEDKNNLA
jgi:Ca2+-binding EF-hand superfamily protein